MKFGVINIMLRTANGRKCRSLGWVKPEGNKSLKDPSI
jgi:hypothetical protein